MLTGWTDRSETGVGMPEDVQADQEKKNRPGGLIPFKEGVLRFSGVQFLSALLLLIVTGPFVEELEYGILIESVLITLVLFSALLAIGGRRRTLVLGSVLVIPALAGKWVNYFRPDLAPPEIFLGAGVLFTGYVVVHLFGFILRAPRVNSGDPLHRHCELPDAGAVMGICVLADWRPEP